MAEEQVVEQTQEQVAADSNAALERGFNKERGLPPPEEKPAEAVPAVEAKAEAAPPAEAQPDPWEGVNPKVKAELESVSAKLAAFDKLPDRLRNIEGHIGGLTSQIKTAFAAKQAVEVKGGEAPTQTQIEQAKTSEKWKQLAQDYPDWAEAMDERLATLKPSQAPVDVAALTASIRAEIEADTGKKLEQVEARAVEFAIVSIQHKGWKQKVQSPEFKAWFGKQAPDIQALANSNAADDALKLLDTYEAAAKAAKKAEVEAAEKAKRLKGAMTPQGVPGNPAVLNDADALERGFNKVRGG